MSVAFVLVCEIVITLCIDEVAKGFRKLLLPNVFYQHQAIVDR